MTTKSTLFVAASGVALTFATAVPAFAQQGATSVGEVVVTAQKRAQNLQSVPLSVSAVTTQSLKTNRVDNVLDLNSLVPNLTVRQSAGASGIADITMRGIAANNSVIGGNMEVGQYINGVYLNAAAGSIFDLPDVERIEVLRGPQGTLFGQNATAGAIAVYTPDPKGRFGLEQTFGVGNYNQFRSKTILDLPPLGPWTMRIAFQHFQRQGDMRNIGAGTVWHYAVLGDQVSPKYLGNENRNTVQAAVKFAPTANFSATYKFWYADQDGSPEGAGYIRTLPYLGINFPGILAAQDQSIMTKASGRAPNAVNNWFSAINRFHNMGQVVTANWRITHDLSVKNTVGYVTGDLQNINGLDGVGGIVVPANKALMGFLAAAPAGQPFPFYANLTGAHNRELSEEFQVNYESHWLTLTVGGLYFDFAGSQGGPTGAPNNLNFKALPNFTVPLVPGSAQVRVRDRQQAAYGQAEVHITPQLDFVLGGRYTWDEKNSSAAQPGLPSFGEYYDAEPTWMIGLNYKIVRDVMVYVKYATSFTSGGTQSVWAWQPEFAQSYEAGIKSEFFEHRLRANLALWHVNYEGAMVNVGGGTLAALFNRPQLIQISSTVGNVGSLNAKGFELELTAIPAPRLTMGLNLGYTDAHYYNVVPAFATPYYPYPAWRPKWTIGLSGHYDTTPIWNEAYLSGSITANYQSAQSTISQFYIFALRAESLEPAEWTVNGRLALTNIMIDGHKAEAAIWFKNLLDNRSQVFGLTIPWIDSVVYERARTFGLDVTFTY